LVGEKERMIKPCQQLEVKRVGMWISKGGRRLGDFFVTQQKSPSSLGFRGSGVEWGRMERGEGAGGVEGNEKLSYVQI
jgi:hypothetical protein